jgi:hypothetical protein
VGSSERRSARYVRRVGPRDGLAVATPPRLSQPVPTNLSHSHQDARIWVAAKHVRGALNGEPLPGWTHQPRLSGTVLSLWPHASHVVWGLRTCRVDQRLAAPRVLVSGLSRALSHRPLTARERSRESKELWPRRVHAARGPGRRIHGRHRHGSRRRRARPHGHRPLGDLAGRHAHRQDADRPGQREGRRRFRQRGLRRRPVLARLGSLQGHHRERRHRHLHGRRVRPVGRGAHAHDWRRCARPSRKKTRPCAGAFASAGERLPWRRRVEEREGSPIIAPEWD